MQCDRNSVVVEETTDRGTPYKLWSADRYKCPTCGHEIVSGFGRRPLAEHFQTDDYARVLERTPADELHREQPC